MIQDEKSRLWNCGHVPSRFLPSEATYRTKSPKILQRKGCKIGKVLVYAHCVQKTWAFQGPWWCALNGTNLVQCFWTFYPQKKSHNEFKTTFRESKTSRIVQIYHHEHFFMLSCPCQEYIVERSKYINQFQFTPLNFFCIEKQY